MRKESLAIKPRAKPEALMRIMTGREKIGVQKKESTASRMRIGKERVANQITLLEKMENLYFMVVPLFMMKSVNIICFPMKLV